MNIVDKNLSRIIKTKLCTSNIMNMEDIEDIVIQDINLMQRRLHIDLTEITKLKNLKDVSLKFFEITDEVIESINQLEFLEKIEFSMCHFKTNQKIKNLKSITIYNCPNFEAEVLGSHNILEELEIIHSGTVNIEKLAGFQNLKFLKLSDGNVMNISQIAIFENLETLFLNNVEILSNIDIHRMKNLQFISLNGSTVRNKEDYMQKLYQQNANIVIEFEENNLPIE